MAKRSKPYTALIESGIAPERVAPILFLEELKASLMHTRLFTADLQPRPGDPYANKVASTEGDIEEWLIKHGFWESEEYEGDFELLIGALKAVRMDPRHDHLNAELD